MSDEPRGRAIGRRPPRRAALSPRSPAPQPAPPAGGAPPPPQPEFGTVVGATLRKAPEPTLEGSAVPMADRRRRTLGAAFGLFGSGMLMLASLVYAWVRDPPKPPPPAAEDAPLISQEVADATLGGKPIRVRRRVLPPAPVPADATIVLPDHQHAGPWALRCRSINGIEPIARGRVERSQRNVLIPMVPPTACKVSFPSSGWREVSVTAGAKRTCTLDGNLICR